MFDLVHDLKVAKTIQAIVGNNTTEGTGVTVDRQGYERVMLVFLLGISADTLSGTVKFLASVEVSDNDSDWVAAAAGDLIGSTLALVDDPAEDDVVQVVEYIGASRYVRGLVTFTGTHTSGTPIAALAILGNALHNPAGATQAP